MYKPPEGTNRVKSIKSKFENADITNNNDLKNRGRTGKILIKSKTELNIEYPKGQSLSRQLSDPSKRNIKRTPAFRLDKNAIDKSTFQRNMLQTQCNKSKSQYSTSNNRKDCDKLIQNKYTDIRSKFDNNTHHNQSITDSTNSNTTKNLSFLYTEPIPKSMRNKTNTTVKTPIKNCDEIIEENIYNTATLKITERINSDVALTDTLRSALKKPLPAGPAPKKPPRTFAHSAKTNSNLISSLNKSFTKELNTNLKKRVIGKTKGDPKYMLDKLESALKNNRIRLKKQSKIDTTSGDDDSDDCVLDRRRPIQVLQPIPAPNSNSCSNSTKLNLNCLNALTCTTSTYEKIKESNSSFFVACKKEEPVYAEPFQFSDGVSEDEGKNTRNSLYYMSSPVLDISDEYSPKNDVKMNSNNKDADKKAEWYETSSVSSTYTSDLESASSTPVEEKKNCFKRGSKISSLIQTFETKSCENKMKGTMNGDEFDANVRVQKLKEALQSSLENSFKTSALCKLTSNSDNSESADENAEFRHSSDDMTDKFTTYVRSVRIYSEPKNKTDNRLFHCCLIVGLNNREPFIKAKFPKNVEIPHKIEALCFPDGVDGPMDQNYNAQCYSLVITNDKGERTFGYCRRVIPEGSKKCLPLAYCILSKHRLPRFYKKVLAELESRHGLPDRLRDDLISEFYNQRLPQPGESVRIDLMKITKAENESLLSLQEDDKVNELDLKSHVYVGSNKGQYGTISRSHTLQSNKSDVDVINIPTTPVSATNPLVKSHTLPVNNHNSNSLCDELTLMLHQDIRYEETDLRILHDALPLDILQKIFGSLLLERRVILVSCVLSTLSSCIEALQSILYPFSWPHTLIPILPKTYWEIVEAPTPFICGVLSVEIVNYKIENALVVDLDSRAILEDVGDEQKILPSCLLGTWKDGISVANTVPTKDTAHALLLSDAYLRVFIQSCGHYKQFLANGEFQKEAFLKGAKGRGVVRFLKWFMETTMFNMFVEAVEKNPCSFNIFDKRIEIYLSQGSPYILDKMREWKKKPNKGFFHFD